MDSGYISLTVPPAHHRLDLKAGESCDAPRHGRNACRRRNDNQGILDPSHRGHLRGDPVTVRQQREESADHPQKASPDGR